MAALGGHCGCWGGGHAEGSQQCLLSCLILLGGLKSKSTGNHIGILVSYALATCNGVVVMLNWKRGLWDDTEGEGLVFF